MSMVGIVVYLLVSAFAGSTASDERLKGFWTMGGRFATSDMSGNGNHLTINNVATTAGPSGRPDGAYHLKGAANSYIQIPNNGALDVRYSFTFALYVKVTKTSYGPLFEWSYNDWGVHLWVFPNYKFFNRIVKRGVGLTAGLVYNVNTFNGKWQFVATTYNYNSGVMTVYADGKEIGHMSLGSHQLETTRYVRMGARDKSGDRRYLAADVACVQLYNKALSLQEIFTTVKARCPQAPDERLKGFWPMGGKFTTSDLSGKGNRLALSNVATTAGPSGRPDGAYHLKGAANSYIQIPNNGALDVRYSFTFALYVKVTKTSYGPLFEWSYNDWGVHLWVFPNYKFFNRIVKRGVGLTAGLVYSVNTFNGKWQFVATTYNYNSGVMTVYADGKEIGHMSLGSHQLETTRYVRMGARDKSSDRRYLAADIACVQLYNQELSIQEIFTTVKARCP